MISPGYWIKENIFTDDEIERLLRILSGGIRRSRAGARHLMSIPEIGELARDERLIALCREITDLTLIPYKATLFEKTGKANWLVAFHQDTALPVESPAALPGWGPSSIKEGVAFSHAPTSVLGKILALRIHLDPSTDTNGPLRVIPNSHHERILSDKLFEELIQNNPEVVCTVGRGGVIAMSPLLLHASSKALDNQPRRVLHIEYTETLDLTNDTRLAIA